MEERFDVRMGAWRDLPAGPHLTVLLHPRSGHPLDDHTVNSVWMGEVLAVNTQFLRKFEAARCRAEVDRSKHDCPAT